MVLIVIAGDFTSSSKYKARKEGRAIKIRMIAGTAVQIISIVCPSNNFKLVRLFNIRVINR
jgi:hypothetical protein